MYVNEYNYTIFSGCLEKSPWDTITEVLISQTIYDLVPYIVEYVNCPEQRFLFLQPSSVYS